MMLLHTPPQREKGRWYCGPFAYAAITGASFEESRRRINHARGMKENTGITGLSTDTLLAALKQAGKRIQLHYKAVDTLDRKYGHTLNSYLKTLKNDPDHSVLLVLLTDHFVVLQKNTWFIDNHTKHPVGAFMAPGQRKQVKAVYRIK
jgi:hypothetical protein